MIQLPAFDDLAKKHAWLIANKQLLIAQKKSTMKLADAVHSILLPIENKAITDKSEGAVSPDAKKITVSSVINTTKLFDSHGDVHIDGLWNKSISESKGDYLVKEHNFSFDGIISDNVKVSVKEIPWTDLGYDYPGKTQALIYTSEIKRKDKTGMFEKYLNGKVKQHSVGMRYVKIQLAIDNKKYPDEAKVWKDYYDMIANKSDVDEAGYFWAVTEAKNIEGSAVLRGSNHITPTLQISETKDQPDKSTDERKPLYALDLGRTQSKTIYSLNI